MVSSIEDLFKKGKVGDLIKAIEEDRATTNQTVLDFIGLVERYDGYKAEEYNVTTIDGYILGLHRITASPKSPKAEGKPVVFLLHGIFLSSDHFVILRPNQSLGFQLADAGYDVWLGNSRGNSYSKSHIKYSTADPAFWDFRMDQTGVNDTSAFIDFVLEKTGQKKLTYIGYSMGTTLSYILLSSKPEYNAKINLLVSIAPIAYFTPNLFERAAALIAPAIIRFITNDPESAYQSSRSAFIRKFFNYVSPSFIKIFFAAFTDIKYMNSSDIPEILTRFPDSTSYFTVDHLLQIFKKGALRKYDYSCDALHPSCKNKIIYNQTEPPIYDLALITVPNAIFYAPKDVFIEEKDAEKLRDAFPNIVVFEEIPEKHFNHGDFIWSTKAKTFVFDKLIEVILNYTF